MQDRISRRSALIAVATLFLAAVPSPGVEPGSLALLGERPAAGTANQETKSKKYHVQTEGDLDRILAKEGYWKKYISGSESLTGAESRYHWEHKEVKSWGNWAWEWTAGTISTLASPGDIAPWTFRNVSYNKYYRAYDDYLHYMHYYGYLNPDVYNARKKWLDGKLYN